MKLSRIETKTVGSFALSLTSMEESQGSRRMEEKVRRVTDRFQGGGDQTSERALQCESEKVVTGCPGDDEP